MSVLGGPDAPVLVITGGTGSGKSTLCRWLAQRGAFVIEADRVGHEMLLVADVRRAICEEFGEDVLGADGEIDRRVLGPRVFASDEAARSLDRLVHPPLVAEIERRVARLRRSRAVQLIVIDAALHFQFEPPLACDAVLAARVEPGEQRRRIRERDGLDDDQARGRVERQSDVLASLARADAVLDTMRPRAEVRAELLETVDRLLGTRLVESDPPRPPQGRGERE